MVGKTPVAQRPKQLKISAKDRKIERGERNTKYDGRTLTREMCVYTSYWLQVDISTTRSTVKCVISPVDANK